MNGSQLVLRDCKKWENFADEIELDGERRYGLRCGQLGKLVGANKDAQDFVRIHRSAREKDRRPLTQLSRSGFYQPVPKPALCQTDNRKGSRESGS